MQRKYVPRLKLPISSYSVVLNLGKLMALLYSSKAVYTMVKTTGHGVRSPRIKSQLWPVLTVGLQTHHLTSLSPSFFIDTRMRVGVATL